VSGNLHLAWCRLFARGLAASGVREVVISPGSRSTPMVLGVDAEPGLRKHTIIDERAAAFFALGIARLTGAPVALLCTSGTAGAHYFPAVIEASQSRVPLVVITADRPWETYDCAASQTIDQVKLFGDHVRHYAELGLPDAEALPAVMRVAAQAVQAALAPTPGPVHVNARFRKPLEPVDAPRPEPHEAEVERLLRAGPPACFPPQTAPSPEGIAALTDLLRRHPRGLIVAGPAATGQIAARSALSQLSQRLGFPLCAETTSQLRHGAPGPFEIPSFDLLFRHRAFLAAHAPTLVLEFGMPPVAGAYASWLASRPAVARAVIAPHGWNDPHGDATMLLWAEPRQLARELLQGPLRGWSRSLALVPSWVVAQHEIDRAREEDLAIDPLSEPAIARLVASRLPEQGALLIGNSGPIRDLDQHGGALAEGVRVIHQRGAAGIDGWIASAAGVRAAHDGPVALFLGDIALLHDVGSLALAAEARRPLVIVVTNNDGGRIFEQLPLARRPEVAGAFEQHFLTPHHRSFGAAAAAWGLGYEQVRTREELSAALTRGFAHPGATIIEATIDPVAAAARRQALGRAIDARLGAIP
jgi:2-succinyl-5-enolpyruvyl-6-hydroxy-3-cyclohexene-1-carboxylate synthase